MKHGKKILAVLSAAAIAASMSLPAFAADKGNITTFMESGESAESIQPRDIVYDLDIHDANGTYTTGKISCPKGDGSALRVFYRNDSENDCKVILKKAGLFGNTEVDSMTVVAGGNDHFTYDGADGKTFILRYKAKMAAQ